MAKKGVVMATLKQMSGVDRKLIRGEQGSRFSSSFVA